MTSTPNIGVLLVTVILVIQCSPVSAVFNDSYGNTVYDNGTITWVPIPVGNKTYITENYYDDGGLGTLFGFSRSFINTVQPNEFPYGEIKTFFSK